MLDETKSKGTIELIIDYKDGHREIKKFTNTVLIAGRAALASCLANEIGDSFNFYINSMIFGTNGTDVNGVPKYVDANRTGLFGPTLLNLPVTAIIDPSATTSVTFTSVIPFGSSGILSEMAIVMNNENLYSMATFPEFTLQTTMQITYNWNQSFV